MGGCGTRNNQKRTGMSRKKTALTKAGRKRKPGAGRPRLGKVKMTVHILPATRQALGDKPGEVLDAHFGGSTAGAGLSKP